MPVGDLFKYKPQIDFRKSNSYYVEITGADGVELADFVKEVTLPSVSCNAEEVRMGGFTRQIPARNDFGDLSITFYDNAEGDITYKLYDWFNKAVDFKDGTSNHDIDNYTKEIRVYSFVESNGANKELDFKKGLIWRFQRAWIKDINFGMFEYDSVENVEISVTFAFWLFTIEQRDGKGND